MIFLLRFIKSYDRLFALKERDQPATDITFYMEIKKNFRVPNKLGLHARTASQIVSLANRFKSQLYIRKDDEDDEVDGRSILSILTLACPQGSEIQVRVVGEDAEELMDAIAELIEQGFGED